MISPDRLSGLIRVRLGMMKARHSLRRSEVSGGCGPIASVHIGMIALPSIQSRTTAPTADYPENRRARHRHRTHSLKNSPPNHAVG